ncbi:MAG TPA: sulfatase-like hydrolase/transferase [Planctomycetaceae bacterium]|nr:sulfatase-like hydrolase/transferase [Planctomycetaceae bacterium]
MAAEDRRPNIVIVLADDLGYGDLGCYGNDVVRTPHLDRFAAEGLRLTDCYAAAANCSPARAGLLTGRIPYRAGIHNWIPMGSPMHLRNGEVTVANLLREAGYATCHVGKWHLNGRFNEPDQPQPADHGFDHWFSTQNNALPSHRDPDNFVRNGEPVGQLAGYSARNVVAEAVRWMMDGRPKDRPFFLYVCFHEPHEPIATAAEFQELYAGIEDPARRAHHGNISQMDAAFGRLMRAVDDLELRNETFVLFTSDNGPAITARHPHGSAGPLRDKKGSLYEGGIRVPGIIRWTGRVPAGGVSHEPVSGVDLLPTLCAIAGIRPPENRLLDGASLLPLFAGRPVERSTPLYWQFNFSHARPRVALRDGDWKILATLSGPELKPGGDIRAEDQQAIKSAELQSFELYNLREDVGETTDLARREPARLKRMSEQLRQLSGAVRDETPTWPAWDWPRYEASRIRYD